jgi:hypothetical protein
MDPEIMGEIEYSYGQIGTTLYSLSNLKSVKTRTILYP